MISLLKRSNKGGGVLYKTASRWIGVVVIIFLEWSKKAVDKKHLICVNNLPEWVLI